MKKYYSHDICVASAVCHIRSFDQAWIKFLKKKFTISPNGHARPNIYITLTIKGGKTVITKKIDIHHHTAHIHVPSRHYAFRALNSNLKLVCSAILLLNKGIIFHGSSILKKDKCYVFVGLSGAGKSTIVRLANEGILMGDDSSIVQKIGSRYNIFCSPFYEKNFFEKRQLQSTIRGIFVLHKSNRNRITISSNPMEAFRFVWLYFPKSMGKQDRILLKKALWIRSVDMRKYIPVYNIYFKNHPSIWRDLEAL